MTTRNVFLDQNHWIYLAQALQGKGSLDDRIVQTVEEAVAAGELRLPVDVTHLIEMARPNRPARRETVTLVIERLSRSWFFAPWSQVLAVEIARSVAHAIGQPLCDPPNVFGQGFLFAFNDLVRDHFGDVAPDSQRDLEAISAAPGALVDLIVTQADADRLHVKTRIGDRAEADCASVETARKIFCDQPKSMHRRAKVARYLYDHQQLITRALESHGRAFSDLLQMGPAKLEAFIASIPSLNVDCELTLFRDRQWTRAVQPNDFGDLTHLALAVPYCEAVIVEKFWAEGLAQTGLAAKHSCVVLTSLDGLPAFLEARGPVA